MKRKAILWVLMPIFIAFFQFSIKMAAVDMGGMEFSLSWLAHVATVPWMWAAVVSEAVALVVWMKILADHDLSKAFPLSAISYILVLAMGWFVFHEPIFPLQLLAVMLIITGVWFIGTASKTNQH